MMRFKNILFLLAAAVVSVTSCNEVEPEPELPEVESVTNIKNSYADKKISFRGATVTLRFDAVDDWNASLVLATDQEREWASISESTVSGKAGEDCAVRIVFDKNADAQDRKAELWIEVAGYEKECVAVFVQASSGTSVDAEMNLALNTYMHEILTKDYLFADAYNAQEIDMTTKYADFLDKHLLSLGDQNVADGGYRRASQADAGERFIYTNLTEVVAVKAVETGGLGFGPFISTALEQGSQYMAIAPSYVRRGSPAEAAGLRRGDLIYAVNGVQLTTSNYYNYMTSLYQNPSGSYIFSFGRFEPNEQGGYSLSYYESGRAASQVHIYDPVLHASVLTDQDDPSVKIGYLVYESFDLNSQEFLEDAINGFIEQGITDLILDLRFNAGGAVAQSRWLSGCIAGQANGSKTFTEVVYNDGSKENWTFDYGYSNDTDNLGKPTDLGLDRLYVITSYNTASAAELVISSLKGIDFPVYMIGCRTEGKNVGMTVSETTYNGRRFIFSPVTFWVRNAKGWGDYQDGIEPDEYVNNDNTTSEDDADNAFPYSFSDWGNLDFNIALQWAYCEITGKDRWDEWSQKTKSPSSQMCPLDFQPMELSCGRYGNLRY
jgi:C-terminal processing protease CtpA/Prc